MDSHKRSRHRHTAQPQPQPQYNHTVPHRTTLIAVVAIMAIEGMVVAIMDTGMAMDTDMAMEADKQQTRHRLKHPPAMREKRKSECHVRTDRNITRPL